MTLEGRVAEPNALGWQSLSIEFDHDGDDVPDGHTFVEHDGSFSYAPSGINEGPLTIRARTTRWSETEAGEAFGDWTDLSFTYAARVPVVSSLRLTMAGTQPSTSFVTSNASLVGRSSLGNPYELSLLDQDGRLGIDLGVYGVPETFVIDKQGVIRYKQIGPLTPEAWEQKLAPLIKELS